MFSVNDTPEGSIDQNQQILIDKCSSVFIYVDFPRLKWHIYKETTQIFSFSNIYHHNLREYSRLFLLILNPNLRDLLSLFSGYKVKTFASVFC